MITPTAAALAQDRGNSISPDDTLVYVGSYTGDNSKGIYLYKLTLKNRDASQNQALEPFGLAAETPSPSFLALVPHRRLLFAVNEVNEYAGQRSGAVSAFSIEPTTGKLKLLNQRASMGTGPCHLVLDKDGRHVLVANYGRGSVTVLPVASDGRLGEPSDVEQHTGSSVNPRRQEGPHAHCVTFDPAGRFLFVCDLGLDKVMIYRFDGEQGKLTPHEPAFATVKAGAGPRHMAFRPDGRFAYVVNELDSTITAFAYDAAEGKLTEVQTVSTLPPRFDGPNTTAEIAVHPSGKFVYASNRGRESVALFEIDQDAGTLTYVGEQSTGGKTPRHFEIDAGGELLIIANQNTDTLLVCRIDGGNGQLKPFGVLVESPTPVCVKFLEPASRSRD
jgi:6-phosphogluconolactonase